MRGDYSTFGPTIRQLRKERQMTQRTLAARVGLDFTYISKIESTQQPPPSEAVIREMAVALGADTDELIRRSGKVPTDLERYLLGDPRRIRHLRHMSHMPDWMPDVCDICPGDPEASLPILGPILGNNHVK